MSNSDVLVIVQARMGSTRLPGKVLLEVGGKTILDHLLDRLGTKYSLVLATSTEAEDDVLAAHVVARGVRCYRGSAWDVLARFHGAAREAGAIDDTIIIRICADSPLHHDAVVDFAMQQFLNHQLDYFTNAVPPQYEDGITAEVFRFAALDRAFNEAKLLSQREHVTPFIKESGLYLCGFQKFRADYTFKLSVDTADDFELMKIIFNHFAPRTDFTIDEIRNAFSEHPEWLNVNASSVLNAGYIKSLNEDRKVDE